MRRGTGPSRVVLLAGIAGLFTLASTRAWGADRVAVLRFTARGGETTTPQLDAARAATRDAVALVHDTLPSEADLAAAEAAVKDGTPDTTREYRDAGTIAGAQWTLSGHVDARGWTYRLELEACQVATGRVESLARPIDARQAAPQIAEMLALLLRPQGVGDAVPPWDQATAPPAPIPPLAPPPPPYRPVVPSSPEPESQTYGSAHPLALGVGGEVLDAFTRSSVARGSSEAGVFSLTGLYAVRSVAGLELVGEVAAGSIGPTSLRLDVGARYVLGIVPSAHVYAGVEAAAGAFFPLGGDEEPRFSIRAALPVVWAATSSIQLEVYPELAYAVGGSASLGFAGGGARFVLRF
jgi:hypothetical protein